MRFALRFPASDIPLWAELYPAAEDLGVERIARAVRARGYLRQAEFLALCRWKTPRSSRHCARNSAETIRAATSLAFSTRDERAKIEILCLLAGVGWPTASVLLHFSDRQRYPILDFRALWSVRMALPSRCTFEFWWEYTGFTRGLADTTGQSMRTVDRALWQYSKAKQR